MCQKCPKDIRQALFSFTGPHIDFGDLGEVRRLLGGDSTSLTAGEVEQIRDDLLRFADVAFDWWLRRRNAYVAGTLLESHTDGDGDQPSQCL